jgi:predicted transposase YbfD/YdcC
MFATLLDRIDIAGAIITADTMHAQRTHAQYLVGRRGAHYVLTVKRNQPHLHTLLAALPWREVPVADEDRLHWVRDVVHDEGRSQIRTANGPPRHGQLRNLAITVLRLTATTNIAAALRHHASRRMRTLRPVVGRRWCVRRRARSSHAGTRLAIRHPAGS